MPPFYTRGFNASWIVRNMIPIHIRDLRSFPGFRPSAPLRGFRTGTLSNTSAPVKNRNAPWAILDLKKKDRYG